MSKTGCVKVFVIYVFYVARKNEIYKWRLM